MLNLCNLCNLWFLLSFFVGCVLVKGRFLISSSPHLLISLYSFRLPLLSRHPMSTRRLVALLLLLSPVGLGAQDKPVKTKSIVADFGFVNAAGNTSITTFNLSDKFVAQTSDQRVIFTQLFGAV